MDITSSSPQEGFALLRDAVETGRIDVELEKIRRIPRPPTPIATSSSLFLPPPPTMPPINTETTSFGATTSALSGMTGNTRMTNPDEPVATVDQKPSRTPDFTSILPMVSDCSFCTFSSMKDEINE